MKFLLEGERDVEIVGEAAGGEEAVRLVREQKPDLVFLDIQMPVMDGFQVVQTLLGLDELPLIVFSTAYDQYAIKAFEVNAIDYLLKPIEKPRLEQALDRVREALPRREEFVERVRKMTENIKIGTRFLPRIVLRRGEDVMLIEVERVAMLHQEGHRVKAHTDEGDFTANYQNLDEVETQLDPMLFMRLGGDYLVNLRRIAKITQWSGGNYIMALDDAERTEVRLSKSQAKLLKNKVGGAM
jgi:DNA-binding LytR/AlgR family response regulator